MPNLANLMDIAATICELEVSMQIEANHSSTHQQDWEEAIAHLQSAETIVLHLLAAKSQRISGSTTQKPRFQLLRGGLGEKPQTSPGDVPSY